MGRILFAATPSGRKAHDEPPQNPGDHLDCRFVRLGDMGSLKDLADEFVDWITRESELWRRNRPVIPESA